MIITIKQDKDLMNYLIGPVRDSDVETNQNDSNDFPDTNNEHAINQKNQESDKENQPPVSMETHPPPNTVEEVDQYNTEINMAETKI